MNDDPACERAIEASRSVLVALRRKYDCMLEMRRLSESGVDHDARTRMRELAAEFPGSLREIDVLPLRTIEARLRELNDAIDRGGEVMQWMRCIADYHAILRAALRIKRMGLPRDDLSAALSLLAETYVPGSGEPPHADFDAATLNSILNPTGGRLNPWLYRTLERRHGVTPDALERLLFPAPREHG